MGVQKAYSGVQSQLESGANNILKPAVLQPQVAPHAWGTVPGDWILISIWNVSGRRIIGYKSGVNGDISAVQDHVHLQRSCTVPVGVLSLLPRHRRRVRQRREGGSPDRAVHQQRRAADFQRYPRCAASHSADQRKQHNPPRILPQGGRLRHQCTSENIAGSTSLWRTSITNLHSVASTSVLKKLDRAMI